MIPSIILLIAGFAVFLFGLMAIVGDHMRSNYYRDGPCAVIAGIALMSICIATILGYLP